MSIEAELEALRAEVARLRQEVGEQRAAFSMKRQTRCPGCGCRKILHARQVMDRAHMNVHHALALGEVGTWTPEPAGMFEAYVCSDCGLVEWYVPDLSKLRVDGKIFSFVETPDESGPYR